LIGLVAGQAEMVMRIALAVLVVAATAACSGTSISDQANSPAAGGTPNTAATLLHHSGVDRNGLSAAAVEVTSGVTRLDVRVANLGSSLLAATTPVTAGERPVVVLDHGTAQVGLASVAGGGGPSDLQLVLASGVRWTVQLDGGATSENLDLRDAEVNTVSLGAGATRARVTFPTQSGQMRFEETGGLSSLTISAPRRTRTSVHVVGGASSVQLGAVTHTGIAGGTSYIDPGYAAATDRLAINLSAGVSSFRLKRT
jgi:hypothetical protein